MLGLVCFQCVNIFEEDSEDVIECECLHNFCSESCLITHFQFCPETPIGED